MRTRSVTIGLHWHSFNSGNLGVGALSICNLRIIHEKALEFGLSPKYVIIGNAGPCNYLPNEFANICRFVNFSANSAIKHPATILRALFECDIAFDIGEGDSYTDIYGYGRFFKLSASKMISRMRRIPLIVSPQTIGPFNSIVGRHLGRYVLRRSNIVVTRDSLSSEQLGDIGVNECLESTDVAFELPYDQKPSFSLDGKTHVGVNVSGLLSHGGYNSNNQFHLKDDYLSTVREVCAVLSSNPGVQLHLVPHVVSVNNPIEDDYLAAREIFGQFPNARLVERFSSPIEAKTYISRLDAFLGARMHSTIAALSAGVPVLPMAYSRKFAGLFGSLGYPHTIDLKLCSSKDVVQKLQDMLGNLHSYRASCAAATERAEMRLHIYRKSVATAFATMLRSSA